MDAPKTTLQWAYKPSDYFEGEFVKECSEFSIRIKDGLLEAVLKDPRNPVPDTLVAKIESLLRTAFLAREMTVHRPHELMNLTIVHESEPGKRDVTAFISGSECTIHLSGKADLILTDAAGKVVRDTKAERIAAETKFVDEILLASEKDALVPELLRIYQKAVRDPSDELVHLYEILDALAKRFGGLHNAMGKLQISGSDRNKFGQIANEKPLEQGRHRGKHLSNLRAATEQEIQDARAFARMMILNYVRFIS